MSIVNEITLDGWDNFNNEISNLSSNKNDYAFRGHRDSNWSLASNYIRNIIERGEENLSSGDVINVRLRGVSEFNKILENRLNNFKELTERNAPNMLRGQRLNNDICWWALGQHHGLYTPLLDWTKSAYCAAFFAVYDFFDNANKPNGGLTAPNRGISERNGSIAIWKINLSKLKAKDIDERTFRIIDDKELTVPEEEKINKRRQAQKGIFTYMMHDDLATLEEYFEYYNLRDTLTKYTIKIRSQRDIGNGKVQSDTVRFLIELKNKGITYSSLFPDVDGCATEANYLQRLPWLC